MTLELAHQLALTKLVDLLQTLTDPPEIRRVATAILRVKPPKSPDPVPLHRGDQSSQVPPQTPSAARAVPSDTASPSAAQPATPDLSPAGEPIDKAKEHTRRVMMHCHTDRRAELATMTYAQLQHFINNRTVFVTGEDP